MACEFQGLLHGKHTTLEPTLPHTVDHGYPSWKLNLANCEIAMPWKPVLMPKIFSGMVFGLALVGNVVCLVYLIAGFLHTLKSSLDFV